MEIAEIRARLAGLTGRQYWRSLEELAGSDAFQELLHREFPENASEFTDPVGRREFLRVMGASLSLAGVTACTRQPPEKIVPYVKMPEEIIPGRPLFFATAMPFAGGATGLLVENHMGRPTKIEGNPDHPSSLGATDAYAQASVLSLYDPDRSQTITHLAEVRPWGALVAAVQSAMTAQGATQGAGFRLLTQSMTSPTLLDQIQTLMTALPQARWHRYEAAVASPIGPQPMYRLEQADVILSLESDFLSCGPAHLRYAREFAARRRPEAPAGMNRLYLVESCPTPTGSKADHRLPLRAADIMAFAQLVARALGVTPSSGSPPSSPGRGGDRFVPALVKDLQAHRGRSVVIAGEYQPPALHALARAMNEALGNVGQTVVYTQPPADVDYMGSIAELARDMDAGRVQMLAIVGGNPVYDAPADLNFARALGKVPLRIRLGLYHDETSELCHWHVPEAHYLESWSDARTHDGTVTIIQPLIDPLYGGRSAHEFMSLFAGQGERRGYEIVRDYWKTRLQGDFEQAWRRALHDGVIRLENAGPASSANRSAALSASASSQPSASSRTGLEVVFRPDPSVFDGRFANNGWLQELPRPLTKVTWDNAILIAPQTAERFHLVTGDVVSITSKGRTVSGPVWVMPGHAIDSVTLPLGYGRRRAGRVGTGVGFNAYGVRTSDAPWFAGGATLQKTNTRGTLASTQGHFLMEARDLVRAGTLADYRRNPTYAKYEAHTPPKTLTLYPHYEYSGYAWGMAIDNNACHGCNACVVACQAENNSPVVGKDQVARQREMHWLRIDTYFAGDLDNPEIYHQPMMCQHCENAPCEVVCPVAATSHSDEGLNDMVYNRCVGTRYCSHNCPYKVRRFNFMLYSDLTTPSLKLARNPDVTVRTRGVMEKCTYCVQRINSARIDAKREDRNIKDGEILTACQAVCPADAIVFGDINDPDSRVSKLRAEARAYGVLSELNTRPRTSYLAAVRNVNAEIEPDTDKGAMSIHKAPEADAERGTRAPAERHERGAGAPASKQR
jgi:MoCo/4Fe-4S cofactor protein with predicted Tat translocation signal